MLRAEQERLCEMLRAIPAYRECCCFLAESYLTLCNLMDCSPPGASVHGILQARIPMEWVTMPFSRGSSQPKDWTYISCFGRQILYHWPTREAHGESYLVIMNVMMWLLISLSCGNQSHQTLLAITSASCVSSLHWILFLPLQLFSESLHSIILLSP